MNTGIELLFLRGHLINVDLARSLAAAKPTATALAAQPCGRGGAHAGDGVVPEHLRMRMSETAKAAFRRPSL